MIESHIDGGVLFPGLRKTRMFKRGFNQGQVDGINADISAWGSGYSERVPLRDLAYLLATDYHETARTMQPIEEFGNGRGRPYGKRVGRFLKAYFGRGKVQLTWLRNYIFAGEKLGIDLEQFPEKALEMDTAVRVLIQGSEEGWFTGKKLSDFRSFTGKRRVINGTDKAQLIANHAEEFFEALAPALKEGPAPTTTPDNSSEATPMATFFSKILSVGKKILDSGTGKAGTTSILAGLGSILGIEAAGGDVPGIAANVLNGDFMGWLGGILATAISAKKVADAKVEVDEEDEAELTEARPLGPSELQDAIQDVLSGSGTEDDLQDFSQILADLTANGNEVDQPSFLKGLNMGSLLERHGPSSLKEMTSETPPAK